MIYVSLCEVDEETCVKGCIARLDLKTGEVVKLTDDTIIGNMIMSPHGKMILINYRSKGYWTVFDIAGGTEKKIEEINGYAHTDEVAFQDEYHVLTLGDVYTDGDTEIMGAKCIDLRTGEQTASYKECGDYDLAWLYRQEGDMLTIKHVDGSTAIEIRDVKGHPHPLSSRGGYVLLGDPEEADTPFYICDLAGKWYRKIHAPAGLREEVEMYFAVKEGKILLTDGKEAYLIDVSRQ